MHPRPILDRRLGDAILLIRWMVGGVFLTEGIQKFLAPEVWGATRFKVIGIPEPQFSAAFVGVVEIVCAVMLLAGMLTRIASILLLADISVAILTTKIPMLSTAGFLATMREASTDYCMLLGLIFLLFVGAGTLSFDNRSRVRND